MLYVNSVTLAATETPVLKAEDVVPAPWPRRGSNEPASTVDVTFEQTREAALADPLLGTLWMKLFDDSNP